MMITNTHGVGIKYIQGYLDFLTIRKKMNYSYERADQAAAVYNIIKDIRSWISQELSNQKLPISLKEAYCEYRYGIFS